MNGQTNILDILTGGQASRAEQQLQRMQTTATIAMVAAVLALGISALALLGQRR